MGASQSGNQAEPAEELSGDVEDVDLAIDEKPTVGESSSMPNDPPDAQHAEDFDAIGQKQFAGDDDAEQEMSSRDQEGDGDREETETCRQCCLDCIIPQRGNRVNIDEMKNTVWYLFPDKSTRLSAFFILISLASVIATVGVMNDSAATVIGAMIVAPLMTPILGTMLGIVLTDRANALFSFGLVLAGASIAVLLGLIMGYMTNPNAILAENNVQIASRVEPRLTDLIGALATGAVGAIALVRKDIAGSLPGVAIAISLVPPLSVVGLTLSTGRTNDAIGALLLFATNFGSIIFTGCIVMCIYGVPCSITRSRRSSMASLFAFVMVLALLAIIAVPLTYASLRISKQYEITTCLEKRLDDNEALKSTGWEHLLVVTQFEQGDDYRASITLTGPPPIPEDWHNNTTDRIEDAAIDCGVSELKVRYVPQLKVEVVDL